MGSSSPENRFSSGASNDARAASRSTSRPVSSGISDIFLARLADLEKRVETELERGTGAVAGSPSAALALDLVREGWRVGSGLLEMATSATGVRGALASWTASGPVDELGVDAALSETFREVLRPLARRWLGFREGRSAAIPETGGVLLLLNRSGWPLPVEALILWSFLYDGRVGSRPMFVLWDEDLAEIPYISDFMRKIGLATATPENARVLLERGAVVLAFPEGRAAKTKTYDRRYRLARFEASGLIEAAMEADARILPGAVVGNEESFPILGELAGWPVTAQFPLLGPLGLLPLPVAWSVRIGPAVEYSSASVDAGGFDAIADSVRARMQALLGEMLAARGSIVGG